MVIAEFAEFLQKYYARYEEGEKTCEKEQAPSKTPVFLLFFWVKNKIETPAKSNVDKILQKEIYIAKNNVQDFLLVGKSPSGRKLINTLYTFALSFEQQQYARWLHDKKPDDFKNCKD